MESKASCKKLAPSTPPIHVCKAGKRLPSRIVQRPAKRRPASDRIPPCTRIYPGKPPQTSADNSARNHDYASRAAPQAFLPDAVPGSTAPPTTTCTKPNPCPDYKMDRGTPP